MSAVDDIEQVLAAVDAELGIVQDAVPDEPWAGVEVPTGYILTARGVAIDNDDKETLAYRPVWVSAVSRDSKHKSWGRMVHWLDLDDHEHAEAIPAELFHAQGNELAQHLASRGLPIAPGREKKLVRYLIAFQPTARLVSATSTGWHGEAFVLPDRAINATGKERLVFQTSADIGEAIHTAGRFDAWRELMANVPPIVRFLVCASLAAPLRYPLGIEAGGFHLCGATSKGKTTALQAAASVWGCAIDPAIAGGADAYINRWNATSNALEGMAAGFNDLPLVVDEIGEGEGKDFGRTVYRIMSGSGRSRAHRDGSLARRRAWRILLISAGELPVSEYIAEGGAKARGGQLVRLLDLPVETVFPDAASADRIKHGVAEHYGHAGPAFVEWAAKRIEALRSQWQGFDLDQIGSAASSEAGRARKRFALAAFAGELGIEGGILPWQPGEATASAIEAFRLWQEHSAAPDEGRRGILNVRDFILAQASRFETDDVRQTPPNRVGWHRSGLWHFTGNGFREACNGANVRATRRALHEARLLHVNQSDKLTSKLKVNGRTVTVTSVRSEILEYPFPAGNPREPGNLPATARGFQVLPANGEQGTEGTLQAQGSPSSSCENAMGNRGKPVVSRAAPRFPEVPQGNNKPENRERERQVEPARPKGVLQL